MAWSKCAARERCARLGRGDLRVSIGLGLVVVFCARAACSALS
jgi:hypothetical protein